MERVDRLVRTWIASEQEQEIDGTVSGAYPSLYPTILEFMSGVEIVQGNATLLHVVKSLGEFLTSDEDDMRTKGNSSDISPSRMFYISQCQASNSSPLSSRDVLPRSLTDSRVRKSCAARVHTSSDRPSPCKVRTLVAFYCGKLEDTETIIPALKGLVTLTKLPLFASSDAIEVIQA